jgi:hypothetical protein
MNCILFHGRLNEAKISRFGFSVYCKNLSHKKRSVIDCFEKNPSYRSLQLVRDFSECFSLLIELNKI